MKSPINASYQQLLILLTYIVPMLDELFGEPIVVGVINADTGACNEPQHRIDIELPAGLGVLSVETTPSNLGRWFVATCPIFDAPDHCEYAPALGAPAAELHEQARSFALKLQAELRSDLARLRRATAAQVEMLSKLDLE